MFNCIKIVIVYAQCIRPYEVLIVVVSAEVSIHK